MLIDKIVALSTLTVQLVVFFVSDIFIMAICSTALRRTSKFKIEIKRASIYLTISGKNTEIYLTKSLCAASDNGNLTTVLIKTGYLFTTAIPMAAIDQLSQFKYFRNFLYFTLAVGS